MKKIFIVILIFLFANTALFAQNVKNDSTLLKTLKEVVIRANKLPVSVKNYPGSISMVSKSTLSGMPKGIAINEALRLVPGVRIDNQHDGERVHVSIRGQGILVENGLRGIGVVLDGIPLNDPSGFVPDLYSVDWSTVQDIEVLRGPFANMYGESGAAGVIYITTQDGGNKPFSGYVNQTVGSNGFGKTTLQVRGKLQKMDYRVSFSNLRGLGNRDHQAFRGTNFYEKLNFYPTKNIKITQIVSHTDYFQQNPEGLSLQQVAENPKQANPDAIPFNEYQKTNRTTLGLIGRFAVNKHQDFRITGYMRPWKYKETSNTAAEWDNYTNPGVNAQYNFHFATGKVKHFFGVGADFKWQNINTLKLQSAPNPNRPVGLSQLTLTTDTLLANQIVGQRSSNVYAVYQLTAGNFTLTGSLNYDKIHNQLTNLMNAQDTATSMKNFDQTTGRLGISYKITKGITAFTDWSQGFIPPSTEELAANPMAYYGFNTHLFPSTSNSFELGFRGFVGSNFYFELTGFIMKTKNDFFRFKQRGRGNQEVFYGNAGNSNRKGIETYLLYRIAKNLKLQVAYTYSDFKYTSASIDPIYTDQNYVLTTPPAPGQYLPNSPKHQWYAELDYNVTRRLRIMVANEFQSEWAIYTDANVYAGKMDPTIYQNWQKGFTLFHAGVYYDCKIKGLNTEWSFYARNIFNREYMAFTEPDPDGNSYQPGPGREIFGSLKIKF